VIRFGQKSKSCISKSIRSPMAIVSRYEPTLFNIRQNKIA